MSTVFDAHVIAVTEEDGVLLVGFADEQNRAGDYVTLQRTLEPDEQDRELGLDSIHIERGDQSQSCYGGIEHILLTPEAVHLTLSAATAERLGSERELRIGIAPTSSELAALREGLRLLCAENVPLTDHTGTAGA